MKASTLIVGNSTDGTANINLTTGGTLSVSLANGSGSGTTTINQTGKITINGGTLNTDILANNNGGTLSFVAGTLGITGTNGLTITTAGQLGNNFTLTTGQTLNVTNSLNINSSASLTVNAGAVNAGTATLNSNSTLGIGIGGTARSTQYGDLSVTGTAALAGTLAVTFINGFTPTADNRFDILDFSSHSGAFSTVQLPTLTGSLIWNTGQLYSLGVLTVEDSNFLAGDFDRNGHVDASDILPAMKALTNSAGYESQYGVSPANLPIIGDLNGDGTFTNADLQFLLTTLISGGGSSNPVPEPSTLPLFASGLLLSMVAMRGTAFRRNCR